MSPADDMKACAAPGSLAEQMPADVLEVMMKISEAIDGVPLATAQAALVSTIISSIGAFSVSRDHALSLAEGLTIATKVALAVSHVSPESGVVQ